MKSDLIYEIRQYVPFNEQEGKDKQLILSQLETADDIFYRSNPVAHMTASAWVINPSRTEILMAYHNIYHSWSWLGGHADGDEDLLGVAIREVQEESGISSVSPLSTSIFSLESLTVDGHEKRGTYVSSHLHLNITYLLEADDRQQLHIREGENSGVSWFPVESVIEQSNEPWFRERIYSKLNQKLSLFLSGKDI